MLPVESNEDYLEEARMSDWERQLANTPSYGGKVVWRLPDYMSNRQDAMDRHREFFHSPLCLTERFGYTFRMKINLNGDYLSMHVCQVRSKFDHILRWPVCLKIKVTLLCPRDLTQSVTREFEDAYDKPKIEERDVKSFGFFHPFEVIEQDGFVLDDTVYFKMELFTN